MNCVLVFLIFSSAIAAGNAIRCITCKTHEKGANNCKGKLKECPNADDKCVKQIEYTTIGNDKRITVSKGCLSASDENYCSKDFMKFDNPHTTFYIYSECCHKADGCNVDGIYMPKDNKTRNGHKCDTCFAVDCDDCGKTTEMQCKGNQDTCFKFRGSIMRPEEDHFRKYAYNGCFTGAFCSLNFEKLPGIVVASDAWYECK